MRAAKQIGQRPEIKAFSYARVSTPEQAKGDGIRRQIDSARAWAAKRGLPLDETFRDIGVSAAKGRNAAEGELGTFLELVKTGRVARGSYLLVESLDRLSRQPPAKAMKGLLDLVDAGIVVVTLMDEIEYSDTELTKKWPTLLTSLVVMARAYEENDTKGTRVREAWVEKKQKAASEKKPLGRRCPEWMRLIKGKYVLVPERAKIVRRIFRMAREGFGRRRITRALNAEGIATFSTKPGKKPGKWQDSYVSKILSNEATFGVYQPHRRTEAGRETDGPPVEGFYPAAIPADLYFQVHDAKKRRTEARGPRGRVVGLLTGLMFCRSCGARMLTENKGTPPKGARYALCSSYARGAGCTNGHRWRLDRAEEAVVAGLRGLDLRSLLDDGDVAEEAAAVTEFRGRLERARKLRKKYLDIFEVEPDGAGTDEEIGLRIRRHAEEIRSLEAKLRDAEMKVRVLGAAEPVEDRIRSARAIADRLGSASGEELVVLRTKLAEALRGTVAAVRFAKDGITAEYLPSRAPERRLSVRMYPPKNPLEVGILRRRRPEEMEGDDDTFATGLPRRKRSAPAQG